MDRVARTPASTSPALTAPGLDAESREWLQALHSDGAERDEAVARLHALLVRAARFEVGRRRQTLSHLRGDELDDIALEAADDALMSVLRRLDDFRGASRFTTWVYKFGLLEAAVKLRKRAWQGREVPLQPDTWNVFASAELGPDAELEQRELLRAVERAIATALTPHQRRVLVALAVEGGADRRPRGTARDDPRGALQDAARRAAKIAPPPRRMRVHARSAGGALMERPDAKQVLGRLLGPAGPEVGCDVCFEELDRYVELELAGADADAAIPGLRAHLDGCPACREEHESLKALVAGQP